MQASIRRSFSQADVRSPRFVLMAWWIGARIWRRMNTAPSRARGPASPSPRCTAPTTMPIATANNAGRTPRSSSTVHHAMASGPSAFGRAAKNFHSLRSVTRIAVDCASDRPTPQLVRSGYRVLHEFRAPDPSHTGRQENNRVSRADARLSACWRACKLADRGRLAGHRQRPADPRFHVEGFQVSPFEDEFGRHVAMFHPRADFVALRQRLIDEGATLFEPARPTPFERFFFREPVNGYVFEVIQAQDPILEPPSSRAPSPD